MHCGIERFPIGEEHGGSMEGGWLVVVDVAVAEMAEGLGRAGSSARPTDWRGQ
jgi:hypothetical protein